MAHGDYNCCAICDCKMDYNAWEAKTKEEICDECLENCKKLELNIKNIEDLKKYINSGRYDDVKENLIKLNFSFCWYGNELDKEVAYKFLPHISFEQYYKKLNNKENEDE